MSDIVKRLRERNFSVFDGIVRRMSDPLSGEAADEIERLCAQNKKLVSAAEAVCGWDWSENNDDDAVRDIEGLRAAITTSQRGEK